MDDGGGEPFGPSPVARGSLLAAGVGAAAAAAVLMTLALLCARASLRRGGSPRLKAYLASRAAPVEPPAADAEERLLPAQWHGQHQHLVQQQWGAPRYVPPQPVYVQMQPVYHPQQQHQQQQQQYYHPQPQYLPPQQPQHQQFYAQHQQAQPQLIPVQHQHQQQHQQQQRAPPQQPQQQQPHPQQPPQQEAVENAGEADKADADDETAAEEERPAEELAALRGASLFNMATAVLQAALVGATLVLVSEYQTNARLLWVNNDRNQDYSMFWRNHTGPISIERCPVLLTGATSNITDAEFYAGVRHGSAADTWLGLPLFFWPGPAFMVLTLWQFAASGLMQDAGLGVWRRGLLGAALHTGAVSGLAAARARASSWLAPGTATDLLMAVLSFVAMDPLASVQAECATEFFEAGVYPFHLVLTVMGLLALAARGMSRCCPATRRACRVPCVGGAVAVTVYVCVLFVVSYSLAAVPLHVTLSHPTHRDFPLAALLKCLNLALLASRLAQAAYVRVGRAGRAFGDDEGEKGAEEEGKG